MLSRRHPVAIDGWGGKRWASWRSVWWLLALMFIITLAAVLLPAGGAVALGNQAGHGLDSTHPTFSLSCYGVYHIVRAGETIYSIARIYGSTAYRIRYCNGLASYTVYTGQALLVPIYRSP